MAVNSLEAIDELRLTKIWIYTRGIELKRSLKKWWACFVLLRQAFKRLRLMLLVYVKLFLSISIYIFGTLNRTMEISLFCEKIRKNCYFARPHQSCPFPLLALILISPSIRDISESLFPKFSAKDFMFNTSKRLWIYITFCSNKSRRCSILANRADMFSPIPVNDSSNFSNICAC